MPRVTLSSLNQNLELHYDLHGSGKTKILFIMGLFTDGAAWLYQVRQNASRSLMPTLIILSLSDAILLRKNRLSGIANDR